MKGARVKIQYIKSGMKMGTVIAESDECVGVRLDSDPDVPVIVRKSLVSVVLTGI